MEEFDNRGMSLHQALRTGRFWVLCFAAALCNFTLSALNQNVTPHLSDEGYSLATAANISALMLGGLAVGKMSLGWIYDKMGTRRATLFANFCTIFSLLGTIFCRFPPMLAVIILGFAFGNAFGSVAPPLIVQNLYGRREYGAILGVVTACINLGGTVTPVMIGKVYDVFGSYTPAFSAMIATSALVAVCFYLLLSPKAEYREGQ